VPLAFRHQGRRNKTNCGKGEQNFLLLTNPKLRIFLLLENYLEKVHTTALLFCLFVLADKMLPPRAYVVGFSPKNKNVSTTMKFAYNIKST
jgi:hypothetical protein